jgi:SNF2 family DNA or RNA helicase
MLTVTQLASGRLGIKSHFMYRDRIKSVPTALWDPNLKQWTIDSFMLGTLERMFQGELVYKTPRWVILNQPMPDMSAMYEIKDKSIIAPALKLKPYDYQDYGIRFMIDKILQRNFVINADDVGLGKTIQTIGTLKWFIENKGIKKILVICKKSIKKQWMDEFSKFTDLKQSFWIGYTGETPKKRKDAYDAFQKASQGILITNYHSFLNDEALIKALNAEFVVIDEVHTVKTRGGKMHDAISRVAKNLPTIFLTGTPIMSRPEDIFGIVQISDKSYFGNWTDFKDRYLVYDPNGGYGPYRTQDKPAGAKNLDELREKVQDIVIRRTSYEVSIQLPSINIIKMDCESDNVQKKLLEAIDQMRAKLAEQVENARRMPNCEKKDMLIASGEAKSKGLIAATQAVATDPRLFNMSTSKMMQQSFAPLVPKTYKGSAKTQAILDTVEDIVSDSSKVILFTKFKTAANLIKNDIQSKLGQDVLMYTGDENQDQRDQYVDLFKNTDTYNILIGTEAMAEGLNLQCANYVINIDQPDTFAIKTQRIGRARRAGSQFNTVTVYDMITENSKDTERLENIKKNMDLTDALVNIDDAQRVALIKAMKGE